MWQALVSKLVDLIPGLVPQYLPAIFGNVKRYWRFYLPALLVALQLVTGWYAKHEHQLYVSEKVAHANDIRAFKDAEAKATAEAEQIKADLTKRNQERADEADQSYRSLYVKYRANLLRYKAVEGSAQPGGGGQPSDTAKGSDGPSQGSEIHDGLLMISMEDAETCAVNTARLQAAHAWAEQLVKEQHK